MTNAQYIIAEKLQNGTTRFTRSDSPQDGVRYINRRDVNGELVNVPTYCEDLYNTYVESKRGIHHFYDDAMVSDLDNLKMAKVFLNPQAQRDKAARYQALASEAQESAESQERQLNDLNEQIEQLLDDMERIDREGFDSLFTD